MGRVHRVVGILQDQVQLCANFRLFLYQRRHLFPASRKGGFLHRALPQCGRQGNKKRLHVTDDSQVRRAMPADDIAVNVHLDAALGYLGLRTAPVVTLSPPCSCTLNRFLKGAS